MKKIYTIKLTDPAVRARYENVFADIRFGVLLEDIDIFTGEVARMHVDPNEKDPMKNTVVTAALEKMDIVAPVDVNQDLECKVALNYAGTTSMEVGFRIENGGKHIASGYLTFVAVDSAGTPKKVPKYIPQTTEELRRHSDALERKNNRNKALVDCNSPITEEEQQHLDEIMADARAHPDKYAIISQGHHPETMVPQNQNGHNTIFGGYLMNQALELAWAMIYDYSHKRSVVVSIDRIDFVRPVVKGTTLRMHRYVTYVGATTAHTKVIYNQIEQDGDLTTNSFNMVFAGVEDDNFTLTKLPKVAPRDEFEATMYIEGRRRYLAHKSK